MNSKVEMQLNQRELNIIYYALGTYIHEAKSNYEKLGGDYLKEEVGVVNDLIEKIGEEIYQIAKRQEAFEEQLAQDKLNHDLNFKRKFAKYGDY